MVGLAILIVAVFVFTSYRNYRLVKRARASVAAGNLFLAEDIVIAHDGLRKRLLTQELATSLAQKNPALFIGLSQWAKKRKIRLDAPDLNHAVVRFGFFPKRLPGDTGAVSLQAAATKDGVRVRYLRQSLGLYVLARREILRQVSVFSNTGIYGVSWSHTQALLDICTSSDQRRSDSKPVQKVYADLGQLLAYRHLEESHIAEQIGSAQKALRRLKRKLRGSGNLHFHIIQFIQNSGRTMDQLYLAQKYFLCYQHKVCPTFIIDMSPQEYRRYQRLGVNVLPRLSARVVATRGYEVTTRTCQYGGCSRNDTLYRGYVISGIRLAIRKSGTRQAIANQEAAIGQLKQAMTIVRKSDCMYGPASGSLKGVICPSSEMVFGNGSAIAAQFGPEQTLIERIVGDGAWSAGKAQKVSRLKVIYQFPAPGYFNALIGSVAPDAPGPSQFSCKAGPMTRQTWPGLVFDNVPRLDRRGQLRWYQYLEVANLYFPINIKNGYGGLGILSSCDDSLMASYMTHFVLLSTPDGTRVAVVEVDSAGGAGTGLSVNAYRIGRAGLRQVLSIGVMNGAVSFLHGEMMIEGDVTPPGEPMADSVSAQLSFGWNPVEKHFVPLANLSDTTAEFYQSLGAPVENAPLAGLAHIP